jgi:hypothetical protein
MKNILSVSFALLLWISCTPAFKNYKSFASSKEASLWKNDSCGFKGHRDRIAVHIKKHKKGFIGVDEQALIKAFGDPDLILRFDMLEFPDALFYEYSMGSSEIINGKCDDPVASSLCFILDKESRKVIGIRQFVY